MSVVDAQISYPEVAARAAANLPAVFTYDGLLFELVPGTDGARPHLTASKASGPWSWIRAYAVFPAEAIAPDMVSRSDTLPADDLDVAAQPDVDPRFGHRAFLALLTALRELVRQLDDAQRPWRIQ